MNKLVILFLIIISAGCTIPSTTFESTGVLNKKDLVRDPANPHVFRLKSEVDRENQKIKPVEVKPKKDSKKEDKVKEEKVKQQKTETKESKSSVIFSPSSNEVLVEKNIEVEQIKNDDTDIDEQVISEEVLEEKNEVEKSNTFYFVWYILIAPLIIWTVLYLFRKEKS